MIEFLNSLDTSAFLAINGAHSPFFDSFMTMFTGRYIWIPMYAIVLLILFRTCRWHTAILYLAALAAAVFLTDQTCATIIRPVVERLRPSNPDSPISSLVYVVDGYRGGNYGFPSCHAANSMALAMFLTLFVKRRSFTIFIFGWALLNSYSRLYLGVHYPGDLLVGATIGCFFAGICYWGASKLDLRLSSLPRRNRYERLATPLLPPRVAGISGNSPALNITVTGVMVAAFTIILAIIVIASVARTI